jgi:AmiR/NasT family two-component response regulator
MAQAGLNIGQAMADVAAIAVLQHRATQDAQVLNDQLNHALNTRIVIEQAKGMVAERRRIDMHEAFATVRRYARTNNLRLADVARVVTEGRLDTTLPAMNLTQSG